MHSPATTIKVFGSYFLLASLGLVFFPDRLLALFGLPVPDEIWVRVLGLAAGVLAIYYWEAASRDAGHFFATSVYARCFFCVGCLGLTLFAAAPWQVMIFGLISLAGAVWTQVALMKMARHAREPMQC